MRTEAKRNLDISVVFWLLWGSEGGPSSDGWVIYHPRGDRTNQSDFTADRFQVIVPLFTYENGG